MGLAEDICARYGAGLGRPLRYVQLNSFYNGSTGAIMRKLGAELSGLGVESWCLWGRRHETVDAHNRCVATAPGVYAHGALSRLTDRAGFYSKADTRRLLALLDEIDPDVVHLHNVHGYWVNVEMLFGWLAAHRCQVRWTLHDCWSFTGHCPHFQLAGCERWKGGCHDCPQRGGYPASMLRDQSARNWREKRRLFTSVAPERMTLVAPSRWLADLVAQSYLRAYPVEVVPTEVNSEVFAPLESDVRERYGIGGRRMVLGVASPWSERKGLGDLLWLADNLDGHYAVVLVGLDKKQLKTVRRQVVGGVCAARPLDAARASALLAAVRGVTGADDARAKGRAPLVGLARTDSPRELAELYAAADVFVNPTYEDTLPTVNLEAEACGTPVFTYDTGGCRETIGLVAGSRVVDARDQVTS